MPIFSVSSVSGANLDLILKFLNVIPPLNKDREKLVQAPTEYQVRYNIFFFRKDRFRQPLQTQMRLLLAVTVY